MKSKLIILILFFLFFEVRPAFAISFTISNPQQNGEEVVINVSLSGLTSTSCPNSYCYLQAAFTNPSPIKYFGSTKNHNSQWYDYISSPSTSYIQSNFFAFQPISEAWSGQLSLKINIQSSNYHGPGTYNIKAWRYSGNSSSAAGDSGSISVNLQDTTPTPIPTPSPTSTPSPIPTSASTSSSTFIISNTPSQINSDQSFNVSVNLSLPNIPNTAFYLKGAFKKADSSNYFGFTKVSGNWIKNSSTYSDQYSATTDSSGNWSGNLEVKADPDDPGFSGTDDYIFKVGRYSNSGSGPFWSNNTTIKIVDISNSSSNQSNGQSNSSIVNSKSSPTLLDTNKTATAFPSKSIVKIDSRTASIAGAYTSSSSSATPSASAQVKGEKRSINPIVWVGSLLIISGIFSLIFIYLRGRKIV